jgi:hypothetical protein
LRLPWVAGALLDDFYSAEQMWKIGHIGNSDEIMMANNLVFALAKQDKVKDAQALLKHIAFNRATIAEKICLIATAGLVTFRSGDSAGGALKYLTAIELAEKSRLLESAALARVYLAIEESRAKTASAKSSTQSAREHLDKIDQSTRFIYEEKLKRLN